MFILQLSHEQNKNSHPTVLSDLTINGYRDTIAELQCQLALQREELTCCRSDLLQLLASKQQPQKSQSHNDDIIYNNSTFNQQNNDFVNNNGNQGTIYHGSSSHINNMDVTPEDHSDNISTASNQQPTPPKSLNSSNNEDLEDVHTKLLIAELNLEMLRGDFDLNLNEVAALQLHSDRLGLEALRKDMLCEDLRSLLLRAMTSNNKKVVDCLCDYSSVSYFLNVLCCLFLCTLVFLLH